ncbi:hypothetical protein [Cellulomonas fimi]|uniref:Uncharacterized protein n=1 Tax=Cellulomonas fimi (strain ATCC 484 / DSM 20113 / JCM 1341 / CCUG 24087 / LMG 16345 / NBRC 15513 / NCIMB 8980 / NCTC 7547 / NRS-133) TaxID=590998 RepID=F4H348_CELFA|nr:hypothetical protein [Cellulomonas fimi]AEE47666.1 hypothetical protein Celf_3556 [Cellulomonas fimi ATCC 484]NNH07422.1 hypothetical protein [Cellulomonas fimi]VEH36755.1 Uncharacterised protein [Cellulomonas fimi]
MTPHPVRPVPGGAGTPDDDLARAVTAALRSREPDAADVRHATDRIAARIAAADGVAAIRPIRRRAGTVAAATVVTSTLAVVGAGAAAAAHPYTPFAEVVEGAAAVVGVEWSAMPAGYTREQYEAFWGQGYTAEDVAVLSDLWQTDATTAKARAGQLLLDGETVPVPPASTPVTEVLDDPSTAYWDAGYGPAEAEQLAELWGVDLMEAKARAGRMLVDGQELPVEPQH